MIKRIKFRKNKIIVFRLVIIQMKNNENVRQQKLNKEIKIE